MSWITLIFSFFIFRILFQYPYLLAIVVLAYIFRERIPDPTAWFRRRKNYKRLMYEVNINPHDSTARRDLGMVLLEKGQPKEALENFLEALKKDSEFGEVNHFTGLAYLRAGDAAKAVGYLQKAIEIEPKLRYGESYLYLGEALTTLGKPEEALDALKTFLSINNTSIEGMYQYARALAALGRKDEAKQAIEDGIKYHKHNPGFRRRRDWRSNVKLKALRRRM